MSTLSQQPRIHIMTNPNRGQGHHASGHDGPHRPNATASRANPQSEKVLASSDVESTQASISNHLTNGVNGAHTLKHASNTSPSINRGYHPYGGGTTPGFRGRGRGRGNGPRGRGRGSFALPLHS